MGQFMKLSILCSLLTIMLATTAGAVTLSQHLLELSGRKAGICSMPRCADGLLAVAMAQDSKLLIHAMSEKAGDLAAARKSADAAELLGLTVYVEEGSVVKNPLADWSADLLVIDDASDQDLREISPAAVCRVLAPYRGVAIVGRAKSRGAGLTRGKLEAWLTKLNVPGGKIIADEFGLWAIATMPALPGGDDWTHYAHGADQNRFSQDTELKWPCLIQWTGKPYFDGKFDIEVAAGGREFRANATLAVDDTKTDGIIARSAYNGQILWKRKTDDDFGTFGSLIVATPDVVYVKDGNGVLCLDAETGVERQRFATSTDVQRECKWLMLQDGILVTLLGQRPPDSTLRTYPGAAHKPGTSGSFAVEQDWFEDYDLGTELVATDVTAGKELWRVAANRIDPAKLAIAAGHVFFYADRAYASCLDLKSGKTIWKTDAPILQNPKGTGWSITFMITERVAALATPDVYLINSYKDGHCQAFSAQDGKILWGKGLGRDEKMAKLASWDEDKLTGHLSYPLLLNGKLFDKSGTFYDALTGKRTGDRPLTCPAVGDICGPFCASPHAVIGGGGLAYDLDAKLPIPVRGFMKPACLAGAIPADGLLFSGHGNCSGCVEWDGHIAYRSAEGISLPSTATADRLFNGREVKTTGEMASALDWPTYRANNTRSGSSAASAPDKVTTVWIWTPHHSFDARGEMGQGLELQPTQPVCVGNSVFFGTAEGVVRCLERKTGKELWNYPTGGRIVSSPSYWEGKLYVGSGDGYVYCLNTADGSLVWRFRVAPIERRIMIFSHLMSAWPINANVLVAPTTADGNNGAVAYASAGLVGPFGGTYICALDARTGTPRWNTPLCLPATPIAAPAKPPFTRQGDGRSFQLDEKIDASGNGCAPEAIYHAMLMGQDYTYTFQGLKPGAPYTVKAHFVEPWETAVGKRVMAVTINGQPWLQNFDIFAAAGEQNIALAREQASNADQNGMVVIHFTGKGNNALVSGLELLDGGTAVCQVQTGGYGNTKTGFIGDGNSGAPPDASAHELPSATGQMAWYNGKLWLHAADSGTFIIDPATGKVSPAINFGALNIPRFASPTSMRICTYNACRGQDIGIMPGGWVAIGGKEIYWPANSTEQGRNGCTFMRAQPDTVPNGGSGYPDVFTYSLGDSSHSAYGGDAIPVWDDKQTLLLGPTPTLCSKFDDLQAADVAANPFALSKGNGGLRYLINNPVWPAERQLLLKGNAGFGFNKFAPVLAQNAAICLEGPRGGGDSWSVAAHSRTDGSLLWRVPLPAQPVTSSGPAMTRAGSLLVPLLDGRLVCIGDEQEGVSPRPPSGATENTAPGVLVQYYDTASGKEKSESAPVFPIIAPKQDQPYRLRIAGMLNITEPGKYLLSVQSVNTDSLLYLDGREELGANRWGFHPTGDIWLDSGTHTFSLSCRCSGTGTEKLFLRWQKPTANKFVDIDASNLLHIETR